MKKKLYQELAVRIDAYARCVEKGNLEWQEKHLVEIKRLVYEHLPSGSGFDNGTTMDTVGSTGDKLIFDTAFHHMDENGFYDGWSKHTVTVRASMLFDFVMTISGRDRNDIKEYIDHTFRTALSMELPEVLMTPATSVPAQPVVS